MVPIIPLLLFFTASLVSLSPPTTGQKNEGPPSLFASPLLKRLSDIRSTIRQNQDQPLKVLQNLLPIGSGPGGLFRRPGTDRNQGNNKPADPASHNDAATKNNQATTPSSPTVPEDKIIGAPPSAQPNEQPTNPGIEETKPLKTIPTPPPSQESASDDPTKSEPQQKDTKPEEGLKRKIISAPCLGGGGHDGSCREAF